VPLESKTQLYQQRQLEGTGEWVKVSYTLALLHPMSVATYVKLPENLSLLQITRLQTGNYTNQMPDR